MPGGPQSKTRRELMLEEMGLTPTWRLRAPANSAAQAVVPAGDMPAQAGTTETAASQPASQPILQPASQAAAAHAAAQTPSPAAADDRREVIMRMDWPALRASVASCTACQLHARRNKTVFGVGDEHADWLFVGEGPGADEDAQGEPFVGQAGKLLDSMLAAIGIKRGNNAYIANVVKCRPPGNRNPEPAEALACEPYLHRQIELIKPKLIVALGKVAAVNLLAREASVASMRGRIHEYRGIPLIVTYHPAYLLRNLPDKAKAWIDLCFAVETMRGLQDDGSAANKEIAT
jgi:uracil-DNA glycosylase